MVGRRGSRDLSGQRFGRLLVLHRERTETYGNASWRCRCDCGNEKVIGAGNLTGSGRIRSCGCFAAERRRRICSIAGCGRKHRSKGLCGPHYAQHYVATRERPPDLTIERLREVLHYDSQEGVFLRIGGARPDLFGHESSADGVGDRYPRVTIDGRRYLCHILAWFYVHGFWPEKEIDHRDGNRSNYRIGNLREASRLMNAQNRRKPGSNNTSGYLGVSLDAQRNLWTARIKIPKGKYKLLGRFATKERAYAAYVEAKRRYHEGCTL